MRRFVLLFSLVACAKPEARDAAWESHALQLSGQWAVRYQYDTSGSAVNGSMDLTANGTIDREYPRIGLPTDYGTYAVPFRGLGGPPSGARVPAVVAGFVRADSVYVFFETDRAGFAMQMRGRLLNDTVRGAWSAGHTRGTIASGHFIMTRR